MAKSKKKFKAEVQQLLDLVIHSLYSHTDVFLRELLSNASDAIDRLRFQALTEKNLLDKDPEWKITIQRDEENKVLTISDNGIGMTREDIESNLGTIARSGTKSFLESIKNTKDKDSVDMIGQFGVGFYSSFMVTEKVIVITRKAGEEKGVRWISNGLGNYTIEDWDKEGRGTEVYLHLKEDKKEYLDEWKIREIVKKFSDFIEYPILMDIIREEEPTDDKGNPKEGAEKIKKVEAQTLNSMKAIWMRPKKDIEEKDYNDFYQHISHDHAEPLKTVHYIAEGTINFTALLYLPSKAPFDILFRDEHKGGIHLYVKRVFIMDNCKGIIPEYLRFVRGVIESDDLPLNVSRELLQENPLVQKIQKNITGKILNTLKEIKEKTPEKYTSFYQEFGKIIKEGVHSDFKNKDKLQELLLFESAQTEAGKYISLKEYVQKMSSSQKEIYYLSGENRDAVINSPHIEVFQKKNLDVLFMLDPIDEWVIQAIPSYDDKKFKAIDRGNIQFDANDGDQEKEAQDKEKDSDKGKFSVFLSHLKEKLTDSVKEVKLSSRLTDSPSCLVADEFGMSAHMERIFKAMNKETPPEKRVLEVNPSHDLINLMLSMYDNNKEDAKLNEYIELLYDLALLAEGSPVKTPSRLCRSISSLMML